MKPPPRIGFFGEHLSFYQTRWFLSSLKTPIQIQAPSVQAIPSTAPRLRSKAFLFAGARRALAASKPLPAAGAEAEAAACWGELGMSKTDQVALGQKNATLGDHRFWFILPFTNRLFKVPFFDPQPGCFYGLAARNMYFFLKSLKFNSSTIPFEGLGGGSERVASKLFEELLRLLQLFLRYFWVSCLLFSLISCSLMISSPPKTSVRVNLPFFPFLLIKSGVEVWSRGYFGLSH